MPRLKDPSALPPEYRRLRQKLSHVGWIALGSLVERDQPGQGGPRYQWSRRIGPKTVTVALSAEQFRSGKTGLRRRHQAMRIFPRAGG